MRTGAAATAPVVTLMWPASGGAAGVPAVTASMAATVGSGTGAGVVWAPGTGALAATAGVVSCGPVAADAGDTPSSWEKVESNDPSGCVMRCGAVAADACVSSRDSSDVSSSCIVGSVGIDSAWAE